MTYGLTLLRVIRTTRNEMQFLNEQIKTKQNKMISNHDPDFANILNAFWLTAITFVSRKKKIAFLSRQRGANCHKKFKFWPVKFLALCGIRWYRAEYILRSRYYFMLWYGSKYYQSLLLCGSLAPPRACTCVACVCPNSL